MADQAIDTRPSFTPGTEPDRPLSPHLQVWRWTVTMASSIMQRATGGALYAGSILLVAWLTSAALGEDSYNAVTGFLGSPFGLIILFGFTWAQMFHLCKGILHLIWDAGHLIDKEHALMCAWGTFIGSAVFTGLIWAAALMMGA